MKVVRMNKDIPLPAYETPGSAGMDLRAAIPALLAPGARTVVPTGLKMAIPPGFVGLVCGRSGLAAKYGVVTIPSPGVIDSDYRGDARITMLNLGQQLHEIDVGDRIAQLLIVPVTQIEWEEVEALDETERGEGGFGSTGSS
jgi:dUTP pyrophosphatase